MAPMWLQQEQSPESWGPQLPLPGGPGEHCSQWPEPDRVARCQQLDGGSAGRAGRMGVPRDSPRTGVRTNTWPLPWSWAQVLPTCALSSSLPLSRASQSSPQSIPKVLRPPGVSGWQCNSWGGRVCSLALAPAAQAAGLPGCWPPRLLASPQLLLA